MGGRDVVPDLVLAAGTMTRSKMSVGTAGAASRRRPGLGAVLVGLTLLFCLAQEAAAGSLRCGARIVDPGQTIDEVYALCGEPSARAAATEFVTVRVSRDIAVTRPVTIDAWFYNRGPKQFVRWLTFRDGLLVAIEEGAYGY